jgi:hypothetical protein
VSAQLVKWAQINEPPLPAVGWDPTAKMHSAAAPSLYKPAPILTLSLTPRASLSPSAPPARADPIQGGCAALPAAAGGLPAAPPPPPNRRASLSSYPRHLSLSSGPSPSIPNPGTRCPDGDGPHNTHRGGAATLLIAAGPPPRGGPPLMR